MRLGFLTLAAAIIGCGSNGSIHVSITDDPATGSVQKLLITVSEVRVHDDGDASSTTGDTGATNDGAVGTGWMVLCSTEQTFDLLQLTNGVTLPLCGDETVTVPTGHVSQLRLGVKSAQLVTDSGTQDLVVPSGASSGLKVDVNQDVTKDNTLDIKLDFNAAQSLVQQGNGGWQLKPVLRVLQ